METDDKSLDDLSNDLDSLASQIKSSSAVEGLKQNTNNSETKQENKQDNKEVKDTQNNQNEINRLIQENNQLKDKFVRTYAELENTRRRAEEEKEKTIKYAITKFAEDLIPVMENFYLAFQHNTNSKQGDVFFDGMTLTFNEFKKTFEKNKLTRLYPKGEKFDPNFHQAVSYIESDQEENTIVDVLQAGYTLYDRVIKPAMVVVSKGK